LSSVQPEEEQGLLREVDDLVDVKEDEDERSDLLTERHKGNISL
jgi:cell division FtsZ-interacting protein ZapD